MITFAFTYNMTTEESAADGDHADHGFYVDGWEYSMNHPETHADIMQNGGDYRTLWAPGGLRDVLNTAEGLGIDGTELSSLDPKQDRAFFEKGESRFYSFHMGGVTASTEKRIRRLMDGKKPLVARDLHPIG